MKKIIISLISISVLLLPARVSAEIKYVVLGDSISAGYGLENEEEFFAYQLAESWDYDYSKEVFMGAKNGYTTEDVLDLFTSKPKDNALSKNVKSSLKEAERVTITIGGNDLLGVLYSLFIKEIGDNSLDVNSLQTGILNGNANYILAMLNVINNDASSHENVKLALEKYEENLGLIIDEIFKLNENVEIIITTQYNPYYVFENSDSLSNLYKEFDEVIVKLNEIIKKVSESKKIKVIDVYEHFARNDNPEKLLNATATPANIDFHPSKEGHEVIAYALQGGQMPDIKPEVIKEKDNNIMVYILGSVGVILIAAGAILSLKSIIHKKSKI